MTNDVYVKAEEIQKKIKDFMDIKYITPPWEDKKSECYGCKYHTKTDCDKCAEDLWIKKQCEEV